MLYLLLQPSEDTTVVEEALPYVDTSDAYLSLLGITQTYILQYAS